MMKQMVVTYDTEVLHTIKSFSNANNHELFSCVPPPPLSEILDPPVLGANNWKIKDLTRDA